MTTQATILDIIYKALPSVNEALPPELRLQPTPSELIMGENSKIDSLGFVTLVIAIENELTDAMGSCPSLVEELAAPNINIRSIGELAEFLAKKHQ
ncbi:MAG: hypothetical protein ACOVP3_00905 [Rhodoluna sp.]